MHLKKKLEKPIVAFVVAFFCFVALVAVATAFVGPTQDPSTAGFRSPCAYALSKDDSCTFTRSTDSLEAIREKLDLMIPAISQFQPFQP